MTSTALFNNVKVLDCTLRDGGHLNKWQFPKELASRIYSAVSECELHCIEVGYVSTPGSFPKDTGIWRFSSEEDIRSIVSPGHHTKIAVMGDIGKVGIGEFRDKDESIVDIVRLAFYPGHIKEAIELGEQVIDKGYELSLNLMAITKYSANELRELVSMLYRSRVDTVVVSDSFGSLLPHNVFDLVRMFKSGTGKAIGFHSHNNLELAFANSISAVNAGASIIDATIYGIGRGAGNLPLEVILAHINHHENGSVNMVPLLELIEDKFIDLKKELKWGYNLEYVLSGMLGCHPTYASKLLKQYHFNIRESWPILINVSKQNSIEYNEKILEKAISELGKQKTAEARTSIVDFSLIRPDHVDLTRPSYANRYKDRDFIVLAQGPSLKSNIDAIQAFAKQNNLVILGANYLQGLIVPDYHAFSNFKRFSRYIDFVNLKSKLLLGAYFSENVVRHYTKREFERIPYIDDSTSGFDIKDGVIQSNCGSISILLIAVAITMGARKIYVVGLDGYKLIDGAAVHFYDEKEVERGRELASLHETCKRYLDEIKTYQIKHGLEPFKIVTPTAYENHYVGLESLQ